MLITQFMNIVILNSLYSKDEGNQMEFLWDIFKTKALID